MSSSRLSKPAMILKKIIIETKPGQRAAFLEAQAIWNAAMAACDGFLGVTVASVGESAEIEILTLWRDHDSLAGFMAGDHDKVERETGIAETYSRCEVTLMDVVQQLPAID
ncbi:MAG: DUF4937 domain-containing protein [Maritimibacter sp.]